MLYKTQKFCLWVSLLVALLNASLYAQNKALVHNQCLKNNQLIKKTLDKDNDLYWGIENNRIGDEVFYPWMEGMKALKIRHASAEVYFDKRGEKLLLNLKRIDFLRSYYDFQSKIQVRITDYLGDMQDLRDGLKPVFFIEAIKLLEIVKVKKDGCGSLYLNLLDDACLPVSNAIPYIETNCRQD